MLDENPAQVQNWQDSPLASRSRTKPLPLVLIHDGGGTTFGYWLLGALDRDVWALHNPHFETSEPWSGGIDEMARTYVQMIKNAGISGRILLGGWSMGGYLSLAMARLLQSEEVSGKGNISVSGLLIIDSPYHKPEIRSKQHATPDVGELPKLVRSCYTQCEEMLKEWTLPIWSPEESSGSGQQDVSTKLQAQPQLPPAVLLRCTKKVPVKDSTGEKAAVDEYRDQAMLGWEDNYPKFIHTTLAVDAHHYNLFELSKAEETTVVVNNALKILDAQLT